jgi:hypothetical protein
MIYELTVTAQYPRDADTVFAEAARFDEMIDTTRGVATYRGLPDGPMKQGKTYTAYVVVWGILHNPRYEVTVDRVDPAARIVQTREHGRSIRRWDHWLTVTPDDGGCIWTDRVVIDSGWLGPVMVRIARSLYRARHRNRNAARLSCLIRRL